VEARLRKLTRLLEDPKFSPYITIHPYPNPIQSKKYDYQFGASYYFGIKCIAEKETNGIVDIR